MSLSKPNATSNGVGASRVPDGRDRDMRAPVTEPLMPTAGARQGSMPPMRQAEEQFEPFAAGNSDFPLADDGGFAPLAASGGGGSDFADFNDGSGGNGVPIGDTGAGRGGFDPSQFQDSRAMSRRRMEAPRFPQPEVMTKGDKISDSNMNDALERFQADRNRGIQPSLSEQRR
ncbi:hypothetical protein HDV00_005450 [Rhizophlyctis rosea]|nr:hypothetical protein HDV00_005450 [Rhizophlyctis rosea]